MINSAEIATLISSPQMINADHLPELRSLCDKHPYAQVFPILLLKGLSNIGDTSFDDELQRQSFKITDRVKLYELITNYEVESKHIEEPEAHLITTEEDPEIELIVEKADTESSTESKDDEHDALSPIEDEITEKVEQLPDTEAKETHEDAIISNDKPADAVEELILHHAFAAGYQLDELTPEEEKALEEREEIKQEETVEFESTNNRPETEEPLTFTGWLHADSNYIEPSNEDKEAINSVVNSFEDFDPLADLAGEIEKPKAEFFSPVKKAKESLSEETLPVSETLAKIYYLQGNYPKAIEAYEQLSLKYPEKKIFFANQIRDLKKKLNT